jgi:spermidine/putrescine transport system permease protein
VTPEINAIGTVVLTVSLILLFSAQFLLRRGEKPKAKTA